LGSGRQWAKLTTDLGPACRIIAPDISGSGSAPGPAFLPMTLREELDYLGTSIEGAEGPLARVGRRSFGFLTGAGINPSRMACFRASLRARRMASDFSRAAFSEGFS